MKNLTRIIFALSSLLVLLAAFLIFLEIKAIKNTITLFNAAHDSRKTDLKPVKWITTEDSLIMNAQFRQAYLLAQIEASHADSIILVINLPDSSAFLSLKGVTIHTAKIIHFKTDPIFMDINPSALLYLLSAPMTVMHHESSIKKVPLMVKIAPKDTSEYIPDIQVDTSDSEPVDYFLETRMGIRFCFFDINKGDFSNRFTRIKNDLKETINHHTSQVLLFASQKEPRYIPSIQLSLTRKDAKIIYRAIPSNANIILKIK